MKLNKHYDSKNDKYYINILPKASINKIVIEITDDKYKIDRNIQNSITNYFGFNSSSNNISKGYNIAENVIEVSQYL